MFKLTTCNQHTSVFSKNTNILAKIQTVQVNNTVLLVILSFLVIPCNGAAKEAMQINVHIDFCPLA